MLSPWTTSAEAMDLAKMVQENSADLAEAVDRAVGYVLAELGANKKDLARSVNNGKRFTQKLVRHNQADLESSLGPALAMVQGAVVENGIELRQAELGALTQGETDGSESNAGPPVGMAQEIGQAGNPGRSFRPGESGIRGGGQLVQGAEGADTISSSGNEDTQGQEVTLGARSIPLSVFCKYIGGQLVCECPPGYTQVGDQCILNDCPPGQHLENGVCVPDICPPGMILENGVCVPACKPGEIPQNGICISAECPQIFDCPVGMHIETYVNAAGQTCQRCMPDTVCPPGQHLVNGVCVPIVPCDLATYQSVQGQCFFCRCKPPDLRECVVTPMPDGVYKVCCHSLTGLDLQSYWQLAKCGPFFSCDPKVCETACKPNDCGACPIDCRKCPPSPPPPPPPTGQCCPNVTCPPSKVTIDNKLSCPPPVIEFKPTINVNVAGPGGGGDGGGEGKPVQEPCLPEGDPGEPARYWFDHCYNEVRGLAMDYFGIGDFAGPEKLEKLSENRFTPIDGGHVV